MISKKPKGLGRGLEALLGGSSDFTNEATAVTEASLSLPVAALQPGKYQPRTYMDETALNELADSIRAQGLLQALLVRPISDGKNGATHEIIAGERRFRAAQLAGLNEVPVLVREVDDKAAAAMALIATPISSSDTVPVPDRTAPISSATETAAPMMPASGSASAKAAARPL